MDAKSIVDKMTEKDNFSRWMGVERIEERAGYSKIRMVVREEMTNGFGILHGGVSYSFADSAFAFASNSHGRKAVSIEISMSHLYSSKVGDVLTAEAVMEHRSNRLAQYIVRLHDQDQRMVGLFKGTVYQINEEF